VPWPSQFWSSPVFQFGGALTAGRNTVVAERLNETPAVAICNPCFLPIFSVRFWRRGMKMKGGLLDSRHCLTPSASAHYVRIDLD
jgi:hypothetical protein